MKRISTHIRLLSWLFAALILASQSVQVLAINSSDEQFFGGNDIFNYDKNAVNCATSVSLSGKDNVEKALNFYMQKGFTLAQAAGIVGNYMAESGVDSRKIQGDPPKIADDTYKPVNRVGFGVAQWTFTDRQGPLVAYMTSQHLGITDLGGQLGFSWQELQTNRKGAYTAVKATSTPMDAAFAFHKYYEGSDDTIEQIRTNRGGNAEKLFTQYQSAPALASGATTAASAGTGCAAPTGNLAKTLLAYAWPTYYKDAKRSPLDEMPAWTAAWQKSKATGLYYGGTPDHPGEDCGAFVTRLIIDSGFDPRYNYGGKISAGAGYTMVQETWLRANWQRIGSGADIKVGGSEEDTKTLRQGDVAIKSALTPGVTGHTFVYVGKVPGFTSSLASASLGERAPMADTYQTATDSHFTWYRKK